MKFTRHAIAFALSLSLASLVQAAPPTEKVIEGAGGAKLLFSDWSVEENGWHKVQWQGTDGRGFRVYPHEFARDAIDGSASAVSPDGRFVMLSGSIRRRRWGSFWRKFRRCRWLWRRRRR